MSEKRSVQQVRQKVGTGCQIFDRSNYQQKAARVNSWEAVCLLFFLLLPLSLSLSLSRFPHSKILPLLGSTQVSAQAKDFYFPSTNLMNCIVGTALLTQETHRLPSQYTRTYNLARNSKRKICSSRVVFPATFLDDLEMALS